MLRETGGSSVEPQPLFIDMQLKKKKKEKKVDLGGRGYLVPGSSFTGARRAELTPYGARLNFHTQ